MSLTLSRRAIDFIISEEITSEDFYNKNYRNPTWPKGKSGITIGIGYDLGYTSEERIKDDWWCEITGNSLFTLLKCQGLKGTAAQVYLKEHPQLQKIVIPIQSAKRVFTYRTLPFYCKAALKIYPQLGELAPDAVGAIVSMVFNRGNSLTDNKEHPEQQSRLEMRNIASLIPSKDYSGISYQIDISKRLWLKSGLGGLVKRREEEARLVHNADRKYDPQELVEIVF